MTSNNHTETPSVAPLDILRRLVRSASVVVASDADGRLVAGSGYRLDLGKATCGCPDHVHRQLACKHLLAAAARYPDLVG